MNRNLKRFLILVLQSSLFWIIAFVVFSLLRYYGIGEEDGLPIEEEFEIPITEWLDLAIILGLTVGVLYALVETFFEKFITRNISIGLSVLLKTVVYLIVLISSITMISVLAENKMDINLDNDLGWWRTDKTFWVICLFFVISSLAFSFIKIANEKFGKGVFLKMLLGTYRKPQEEKHIFMFLDLRSSTTIAEELGHLKYSGFIQDCFFDLNTLLEKYSAQVYQYVGDEAVLNWPYRQGTKDTRCIDLYFAFKKKLEQRREYYLEKYNWQPEFKAGLHGGLLTIAEVGTIKKELAFHGDVINTTARIQSECNKYNEHLLISENLLNDIGHVYKYDVNSIGNINLKGKEERLIIHAIQTSY